MARFLTLWEMDMSRVPENPEDQMSFFTKLMNMVKEDMESGTTRDFGEFINGFEGYSIEEGTEEEVALTAMKYSPYCKFKVYPILSANQIEKIMKTISQA
jgi:hypothetical protein